MDRLPYRPLLAAFSHRFPPLHSYWWSRSLTRWSRSQGSRQGSRQGWAHYHDFRAGRIRNGSRDTYAQWHWQCVTTTTTPLQNHRNSGKII